VKTKSWEVTLNHSWENLMVILNNPQKTLHFFPYFKSLEGDKVKFNVPRFIFNFGYSFTLSVGFQKNRAVYTFTGDKGILTITFEMHGNKLKVTASWAGFGETFMGKPLERFARGIAEALADFCNAQATCPVSDVENGGIVEFITPSTLPALVKRTLWELKGDDFRLEGVAEDGTELSITIIDGKLTELHVKEPGKEEVIVESDVPVLELGEELFEGLPLNKRFKIEVKKVKRP